ncbi:hypothetical protein RS030_111892 [Cryptosporidium xiaoi]|uniref:Protein SDA1 n=1 Tax=Cryptosporidium xiaoi TaxID=659607 RepID=A0AAV9Y2R1_9CRYT
MTDNTLEVYSLPQLQDRIKRDPDAYLSDFELQLQHFYSTLEIFRLNSQNIPKEIFQLMIFIAQTSPYYSIYGVCNYFIEKLVYELKNNAMMTSEMRVTMVTSLILLSNQKIIDIVYLLPLWFDLMRLPDKNLRSKIMKHIVSCIVDANKKNKSNTKKKFKIPLKSKQLSRTFSVSFSSNFGLMDDANKKMICNTPLNEQELKKYNISVGYDLKKFNSTIISFLRGRLNDSKDNIRALTIFIEVYRRNTWNDAQTVNIIADCCTKQNTTKAVSISVKFLLGKNWGMDDIENDISDDEERKELENEAKKAMKSALLGINTNSRKKKLEKAKKILKKKNLKSNESNAVIKSNQCIDLINNPQEFAEELFQRVIRHIDPFEVRQLLISLISRLIERHKLILINYYSFLCRYLSPNNKNVTNILAYLAQACHDLIPPQELSPIIKILMDNFVNECNRPELIIIGLNTIREICCRIPTVLDQDKLMDLANFRNINNKGISIAARSLINLYRDIMPGLLHRSLLNKESAINIRDGNYDESSTLYGHKKIENTVSGTDLLMKYKQLKLEKDNLLEDSNKIEEYTENEKYYSEEDQEFEIEDEEEIEQFDSGSDELDEEDENESECQEIVENRNNELNRNSNIALDKILDQDDFKLIKKLKIRLEATKALGIKNNAKQDISFDEHIISDIENEDDNDLEHSEEDDDSDGSECDDLCRDIKKGITQNFDRIRKNKQQRIESIMKGRENRETFKEKRVKGKLKHRLILIFMIKKK